MYAIVVRVLIIQSYILCLKYMYLCMYIMHVYSNISNTYIYFIWHLYYRIHEILSQRNEISLEEVSRTC